jgi:flagellar hook-basal body complex protein FliE
MMPISSLNSLNLVAGQDLRAELLRGTEVRLPANLSGAAELGADAGISEASGAANPAGSFSNLLNRFVEGVNDKQVAAGEAVRGMLSGQEVSLHQAMIAMEEASVSFQLMVEVRNKLLESYQELMRMQV